MLTDDDRNHLLSIADAVASLHAVDGGLRRDHCLVAAECALNLATAYRPEVP